MQKRKIALAENQGLVREVLAAYLASQLDAEIIEAGSTHELEEHLERNGSVDLILLDLLLPGMKPGLEALSRLLELNQGQPLVLFASNAGPSVVIEALDKGAAGYIDKTQGARSMVNALNFILAGETYLPAFMRLTPRRHASDERGLTPKELEVLGGLTIGLMNKEIAQNMGLSEVTVKMHVRSICAKLNVKNRTQAAMVAAQFGYQEPRAARPGRLEVAAPRPAENPIDLAS
ncbi:response regulator transcription factor (plasmid) [Cereibacter azotoformans]|uniref:response regulator transcription factor n=1 Tax=Cereibacter azotoformans TaxID=43057 RepID=UPI000E35B85B|nr:response regulator transcription factor [Cereibacter azotoformans]AXQ96107.1 DNA-binding response regulator [Cereibacter sphaeroides]UIJ32946.1 response regulator transcription factor [Cereibacter azotoformans]